MNCFSAKLRVAGELAVGAKYLANGDSKTVGVFGSGRLALGSLMALKEEGIGTELDWGRGLEPEWRRGTDVAGVRGPATPALNRWPACGNYAFPERQQENERVKTAKIRKLMSAAAISALIGLSGSTSAYAECERTVRIAENDWTGQLIDVNLALIVMTEHLGIDAELVFADYSAQWVGLANGDLDIGMEIWPSFSYEAHQEWIDEKKKVVKVGDLGVLGESGWYVPTYVIKGDAERGIEPMAPDLKTWKDIEKYADLFKRPETGDKIFCIDAVESWEIRNEQRIEGLGLNMVNVYAGTEGALMAEITGAYARGEPLFICDLWKPHWVQAEYDFTEIELPPYSDECYGVGGLEPGDFACDFPSEMLYNVARAGFEEECPAAYKLIEKMWLTAEHQQEMMVMVDLEGMEPEAAVRIWMADNEDVWRQWLP